MHVSKDYIKQVEEYAIELLLRLPANLCYHNLQHTQEVVEAAKILSQGNRINAEDTEIVLIAAWFHDTGHIKTYFGHEKCSQNLAEDFMKSINYPADRLQKVLACIKATTFPSSPQTLPEKILCDADMYHLSQDYYEERCFALKKEVEGIIEKCIPDGEWCSCNVDFLEKHSYYTPFAAQHLNQKKQENVKKFIDSHIR